MKGYREWLDRLSALEAEAAAIEAKDVPVPHWPELAPDAPVALLCSPHPDDEVITGALPLRLRREGWRVVNLAVTLGSKRERRAERWRELEACGRLLGFENRRLREEGFERITPAGRDAHPAAWTEAVVLVAELLQELAPRAVFHPHAGDVHPTHLGTRYLAIEALRAADLPLAPWGVETEFWGAQPQPNLLVASAIEDLAVLLGGLRQHAGEVARNPYHLRLPAWMSDNVRRGSELLGGAGAAAADFTYGTLYRVTDRGKPLEPRILAPGDSASSLLRV